MAFMRQTTRMALLGALIVSSPAMAADQSGVNAATREVETGANRIGQGEIAKGAEQTAKGIGNTVVEGAKFTGEKFKEAGRAANRSPSFFGGVKSFFTTLFSN